MQGSMIEKQPTFKPVAVTITIENAKELQVLQDFMRYNVSVPDKYCEWEHKSLTSPDHQIISNFMEIFGDLIKTA